MAVRSYNSAQVLVVLAGLVIEGRPDGTFASWAAPDDDWTFVEGNAGDHVRSRVNKRTGELTLTVQYGSSAAETLEQLAEADLNTGRGAFSMRLADVNGGAEITCARAYIRKRPDIEFAAEAGTLEYVIVCPEYTRRVGQLAPL